MNIQSLSIVVPTGHSQNSVGVQNMRAIIDHNGWREI